MPKAFTHLCKKVNLSLYNDTLTVYPKPSLQQSSLPPVKDELSLLFLLLFSKMNCVSAEVNNFFMHRSNELGVYRFVHRDDADHYLYHQDDFEMEDDHYHAQFAIAINEGKLDSILDVLQKYSIISEEEHKSFVKAYHEANAIPKEDLATKQTSVVTPAAKQKEDKPTFGGFKRGFFLSNKEPSKEFDYPDKPSMNTL
ncbi:hypothetical protein DGG96_14920 [Legionella qingyii]|uniref:Uncharacterized protein n=1 Tax=Legionella qingyii TaxID=2184757 RepID=A0A317U2S4_9GAMM|nr:hypothetical protein [Legionella qingyii]PWY54792.1 hypothetical protein DGG96_14920 [Legionella qingyii]RUR22515.1 hypothetical protein ELY20_09505 [Legionella qingyii]RUR27986.1 hypothetical protein ELY16_04240 [Legionella qingyii]